MKTDIGKTAPKNADKEGMTTETPPEESTVGKADTAFKKPRKKRKSSNYSLERFEMIKTLSDDNNVETWFEIWEGFVSPKAALTYIAENKLEGVFRVMRAVTPAQEATVTPQEPVWAMRKVDVEKVEMVVKPKPVTE